MDRYHLQLAERVKSRGTYSLEGDEQYNSTVRDRVSELLKTTCLYAIMHES
jgi:hypothetical protein